MLMVLRRLACNKVVLVAYASAAQFFFADQILEFQVSVLSVPWRHASVNNSIDGFRKDNIAHFQVVISLNYLLAQHQWSSALRSIRSIVNDIINPCLQVKTTIYII